MKSRTALPPPLLGLLLCLVAILHCPPLVLARPFPAHCSLLSASAAPLPSPFSSPSVSRGCPVPRSSPSHPLNGRVSLPLLSAFDDCSLRAFTVEMAGWRQPEGAGTSNWTALAASAMQMSQCPPQPSVGGRGRRTDTVSAPVSASACAAEVWVDGSAGLASGDGSRAAPINSLQAALGLTRSLRMRLAPASPPQQLCIVLKAGTYYLGANASSHSSQVGSVALLPIDSHLTLRAAAGETVVLSGGALLSPRWEKHASLPAGAVYRAKLDSSLELASFNELYVNGRRAVRAKYPNGDPSTHLWTSGSRSGYMDDSDGWWWDPLQPSVDVFASPLRNRSAFSTHQWGLQGEARVFQPPRNFWSTANPPHGSSYIRPSMFTSNLTRMANWTDPAATGQVMLFHQFYWSDCLSRLTQPHRPPRHALSACLLDGCGCLTFAH